MSDALPPSPLSPPASLLPPSPHLEATTSTTPPLSVFDQTTQNLLKLGSLTMNKFAQDPSEELDGFDIPLVDPANPNAAGYYVGDTSATRHSGNEEEMNDEVPNVAPNEAVRYLREVALREFGITSTDPLKYEFLEESGQNRRSCILTITRPNGLSRSYRTKPEFARKSEARIAAATSAIKLGAVNFIRHGEESKVVGKRGLVLAKLDAGVKKDEGDAKSESKILKAEPEPEEEQDDSAVTQIETCCTEWRAGSVIPKWVHLWDHKTPNAHGYALKISLSSNIQRAYSVLISDEYSKKSAAKAACARAALEQDILEFIKHGDGLEHPIVVPFAGAETALPPPPPSVTTLQAFHSALPQPLPDQIGTKANGEINAVAWLNNTVQAAKGSRMTISFTWHTDAKLGLHGCLLRLTRPGDAPARSYLVETIFSRRTDAKLAVCLLACSQGIGDYVREIAAEVDSRVTPEMRRRATEQVLPALGQSLNRFRHGSRPEFSYNSELATFGCTLTVDLSPDEDTPVKKQWSVPLAYKSKADAKFAVVCIAADDGMLDFIRSRGKVTSGRIAGDTPAADQADVELEEGETTLDNVKKKKKKGKKDGTADGGAAADEIADAEAEALKKVRNSRKTEPVFETREEAVAKGRFGSGPRTQQRRDFGNGRGRGGFGGPPRGGFGGNYRGMSSFGPHRPSGVFAGFPARSGLHAPIHSGVPPFPQPPAYPHPAAYGPGYPGGAYGGDHDRRDRGYLFHDRSDSGLAHARRVHGPGAAGANAATPFVHAPPPVPPYVAPGYGGHNDRPRDYGYLPGHDYRSGLYASQSFSGAVPLGPSGQPYGYEHPATAPVMHPPLPHALRRAEAAEYNHTHNGHAGRPAHSVPHAYDSGRYAPDYDRIPDHTVTAVHEPSPPQARFPPHPPSHASPQSHSSHSRGSVPPPIAPRNMRGSMTQQNRIPTGPRGARATYNRPPAQSPPEVAQDGGAASERAPPVESSQSDGPAQRPPPAVSKPESDAHANIEEELNCVISRLEKEADQKAVEQPTGKRRRDTQGNRSRKRSRPNERSRSVDKDHSSNEQTSAVPSKRARSSDPERSRSVHEDRPSNEQTSAVPESKRARLSDPEEDNSRPNQGTRERSKSMSRPSESAMSVDGSEPSGTSRRERDAPPEDPDSDKKESNSPDPVPTDNGKKSLKRARESSPAGEKRKNSEKQDKSYVAALLDHCDKEGIQRPEIYHEETASESEKGDKTFKVWFIMGKERLELAMSFKTLDEGQERVAKSVLGRLRMQKKKRKTA